jgi:uncharacterized protein YrrD
MQFTQGARVLTSDGKDVGHIDQVVMDPQTKEVTHIVVRKGFLFTEDKIVPISLIASADEDAIHLREDAGDLYLLPPFEETHYVLLDDLERGATNYPDVPSLYWLPPAGGWLGYPEGFAYPPPYPVQTTRNIPEGTVALHEGAEVYSSNDELLGHVEEILTDSPTDRASYFVMSSGILLPSKRLVPMTWVQDIYEDRLVLNVGKAMVEQLREYHPAQH